MDVKKYSSVILTRLGQSQFRKYLNYYKFFFLFFFLTYRKMSNSKGLENLKEIENLETVIERHEEVIEN